MCHSPAVDSEESSGAPEAEIEVTAAMVDAGSAALEDFYLGDGRYAITTESIEAIYRAMAASTSLPPASICRIHRGDR